MTDRASVFDALIGRLVWQVERGIGKSLTMEFGDRSSAYQRAGRTPLFHVTEAIRLLRRRRVSVRGDWHLWIELVF